MARLYSPILILTLAITLLSSCSQQSTQQKPQGPADVSMAKHITIAHNISIAETNTADIIVSETNSLVSVTLSSNFLSRVDNDALIVLRFNSSKKTFTKPEYMQFLDQLHAYLVLTPMKARQN